MVLHLTRGERIDQRTILRRLAEMQYKRNELDLSQGNYRVRGDVIDVYSRLKSERDAVRIELFDDEIESLSYFDPLTGEVDTACPPASPSSRNPTTSLHASACCLAAVDEIKDGVKRST